MILHIGVNEGKFLPPFYSFLKEHFNIEDHEFYLFGDDKGFENKEKVVFLNSKRQVISLITVMNNADKIILHGLFSPRIDQLLFMQPWLYKKCYWIMWGGDFYFPEKQSWLRKNVIKKIGYLVTFIDYDYMNVKKWYGSKGLHIKTFAYPSNIFREKILECSSSHATNIQLGNSATKTNNHFQALEKLYQFRNENIKIFCPLSYGDTHYAMQVTNKGRELFGDKFVAITEFMDFERYLNFLSKIDIGIFANNRQQAMGNIRVLLGMGKKVFMDLNLSSAKSFIDLNIKVFDINMLDIDKNFSEKSSNISIVRDTFSEKKLISGLETIFGE